MVSADRMNVLLSYAQYSIILVKCHLYSNMAVVNSFAHLQVKKEQNNNTAPRILQHTVVREENTVCRKKSIYFVLRLARGEDYNFMPSCHFFSSLSPTPYFEFEDQTWDLVDLKIA